MCSALHHLLPSHRGAAAAFSLRLLRLHSSAFTHVRGYEEAVRLIMALLPVKVVEMLLISKQTFLLYYVDTI